MDRINPMQRQVFQKLQTKKHTQRQKEIGFGIQVKDVFRQENLRNIAALLVSPERMKLELIITCLSIFSHLVYTKIIQKHKDKDNNLDVNQFNEDSLLRLLDSNIKEKDWVDVAAIAMMLDQKDELTRGMYKVNTKAIEYNEKIKQIHKEKVNINKEKE